MEGCKVHGVCSATMKELESVRGGNRGNDCFDGGGGRSTRIRSTAGFVGELLGAWVVSLIASRLDPVSICSVARFFRLGGLELEHMGCGDTSQWLKSEEGAFLFALAGLSFVCFAELMSAAAAWTSPLHCTRVSSRTSCPGCGIVSRLVTIPISVSVSASFIADQGSDDVVTREEEQLDYNDSRSGGSATPAFFPCFDIPNSMSKLEPVVAPSSRCHGTAVLLAKLVCDWRRGHVAPFPCGVLTRTSTDSGLIFHRPLLFYIFPPFPFRYHRYRSQ